MDPLNPIPRLQANAGWREIEIAGVDEPLVPVDGIGARIFDRAEYHAWGLPGSLSRSWVRAGVATRLARVAAGIARRVQPRGLGCVPPARGAGGAV